MFKIICIEGTDGSGKQTQSEILTNRLNEQGYNAIRISFPNYQSGSSFPVKMYLNGELGGDVSCLDAYQSSTLFAVDRLCTMKQYENEFKNDKTIFILDRYVQSNMIHQACKIENESQKNKYLKWIENFEFSVLKLPKADLVVFLDVPFKISQKLANSRPTLKAGTSQDIHEKNSAYLKKSYDCAKEISKKFGWVNIDCVENEEIKSIEKISNLIFLQVEKYLKIK